MRFPLLSGQHLCPLATDAPLRLPRSVFLRLRPGPDLKEAFQRWRAFMLEKKRRQAALR